MFQTNLKEGILHIVVEDVDPVPFYSSVPQTIHMGFHRTLHFTVQGTVTSHPIGTREPYTCLLYTSPSPRDRQKSRMPSSA